MTKMSPRLTDAVAAHLAEWDVPHVELSIYGSNDASTIAGAIDGLCSQALGSGVFDVLFYQSSIGAVAGVVLADGRHVVVKAHQPQRSREQLDTVVALQNAIATGTGLAPAVLGGPLPLGRGLATIEVYSDQGTIRDAHDPLVRKGLAAGLHSVVRCLDPFVVTVQLPAHLLSTRQPGSLWPEPHSKLFDFEATRAGAEDIDELAAYAMGRMTSAGRTALGHGDWRAEHVRFEGETPVIAFDWDSLCLESEPTLLGFAAHAFCADFTRTDFAQAPTLDEARAFLADYETARSQPFTRAEREACAAAFMYSTAYTARCARALGRNERTQPGTFQHLLVSQGRRLLRW